MADTLDLRRPRVRSSVWLVFWLAASSWIGVVLATAWPYQQLPPQLLLLITVPGILFRAFDLSWLHGRREVLAGWRRWLARGVALPIGILVTMYLSAALDGLSMARFERALAPLVAQLEARRAAPCPPGDRLQPDAGLAAYLERARAPARPADLYHDGRRFVLAVAGRSIDIDGSTIFYDSATQGWRKVHNDVLAQTGELEALVKDLALCRFALR